MSNWIFADTQDKSFSSTKFASFLAAFSFSFLIVATALSPEGSALRDHFILIELLTSSVAVIGGMAWKRNADKKLNNGKAN